jgi:hypothetical protein
MYICILKYKIPNKVNTELLGWWVGVGDTIVFKRVQKQQVGREEGLPFKFLPPRSETIHFNYFYQSNKEP